MSAPPLLFVAADPREFAGFLKHWQNVKPLGIAVHWARSGIWKGQPAAAIANGAGEERAFTSVIMAGKISGVCNIGFGGALDPELDIGDVVLATEVRSGSHSWPAHLPSCPETPGGPVISIDHIAGTAVEKRALRATGASIVEMEAAGVARAAEDLDLPFYCVRAVSDLADEDFSNDFNAALNSEGRFSVARLVTGALASPRKRFGELLRLQRRTAVASKNLGEFLANCNF